MPPRYVQDPTDPNHILTFPDGMSDDDVLTVMKRQFPSTSPVTSSGPKVPFADTAERVVQPTTSQGLGFQKGFMRPVGNVVSGAEWALNKVGGSLNPLMRGINKGLDYVMPSNPVVEDLKTRAKAAGLDPDSVKGTQWINDQIVKDREASGEKPGALGQFAGSVVGTAPAMMATRNPLIGGAAIGAMDTDATTPKGVMTDAAIGALSGKLGDVGMRSTGALVSPMVRPGVNELMRRGVNLTPGQIIGGTPHRIEDAATSMMFPYVADAQARSSNTFHKALVNEALEPLGTKLPDNVEAGHRSVAFAQDKMDEAYSGLLPKLTVMKDTKWTEDSTNLKKLVTEGLPKDYQDMFNSHLKDINKKLDAVGEMSGEPIHGQGKILSGQDFKDIEEVLGKEYKRYSAGLPNDRKYADAIMELQAQMRDMAARNNPAYAEELGKINAGYAHLARVEQAGANAKNGIPTPAQYRAAVVAQDPTARKRASAAGRAYGQDLASTGEDILPRTVGDSGTGSRIALQAATAAALFGGAHFAPEAINPLGAASIGAALSAYTPTGQRVASKILTGRQGPAYKAVRRSLQASAPAVANAASIAEINHRNNVLPEGR